MDMNKEALVFFPDDYNYETYFNVQSEPKPVFNPSSVSIEAMKMTIYSCRRLCKTRYFVRLLPYRKNKILE